MTVWFPTPPPNKVKPPLVFILASGNSLTIFPVAHTKVFKWSLTSLFLVHLISNPSAYLEDHIFKIYPESTTSHLSPLNSNPGYHSLWVITIAFQLFPLHASLQRNCFLCIQPCNTLFSHSSWKELCKTCQSNPLFKNFRVFPSTQRDWSCPGSLCKIYLLLVSLFPWLFQPVHCNRPFRCFLFALLHSVLLCSYWPPFYSSDTWSPSSELQACCICCSLR